MLTSIRFRCQGCQARIKAPSQLLGHERVCPGCGRRLLVVPDPPEDAGPVLIDDDPPYLSLRGHVGFA